MGTATQAPWRCSCAARAEFTDVALATGLHARGCGDCGGMLLSLADYRAWAERHPDAPMAQGSPACPDDAQAAGARACPACARLMQRLRVGSSPDCRLDRCVPCQLVWLDRDEWALLVQAGLATRLPEVLSDAWQRQLRDHELRSRREAGLRARHGDDCIDELARLRRWLDAQPHREELLALLRAGW